MAFTYRDMRCTFHKCILCIFPIDCKITNFSLYLFVYVFENIIKIIITTIMIGLYYHTRCFKTKNGERMAQWLIIGKPKSQYASYAAMFCLLHSSISIRSTSVIHPENTKDVFVMHAPYLDAWKPYSLNFNNFKLILYSSITAVRSFSGMFVYRTEAITHYM